MGGKSWNNGVPYPATHPSVNCRNRVCIGKFIPGSGRHVTTVNQDIIGHFRILFPSDSSDMAFGDNKKGAINKIIKKTCIKLQGHT